MPVIGGSSKYCDACRKWTFFVYIQNDGIIAKICVECKWRRDHPYGGDYDANKDKLPVASL